jgi:hypothetical protein
MDSICKGFTFGSLLLWRTKGKFVVRIALRGATLAAIAAALGCARGRTETKPPTPQARPAARGEPGASARAAAAPVSEASAYSFTPVLRPGFDEIYHEVMVSRGGRVV